MPHDDSDRIQLCEHSPLALAFVGDGVWELLVRAREVERTRLTPGRLHRDAVRFVSAEGQTEVLRFLEPGLSAQEKDLVRRGHNASKASVPKNAPPQVYRASTGFECMLGYLYLSGQNQRIEELFDLSWERFAPDWID